MGIVYYNKRCQSPSCRKFPESAVTPRGDRITIFCPKHWGTDWKASF